MDKKSTMVRKSVFLPLFNWLIFSYNFGKLSIATFISSGFKGKAPGFGGCNDSGTNFLMVTLPISPPSWSDIFLNIWFEIAIKCSISSVSNHLNNSLQVFL